MHLLKLKISLKSSFAASDVFDCAGFYEQYMDKAISYHQIPQQFRVETLAVPTGISKSGEAGLLHYKNWAERKNWLPLYDSAVSIDGPVKNAKGQLTHRQRRKIIPSFCCEESCAYF